MRQLPLATLSLKSRDTGFRNIETMSSYHCHIRSDKIWFMILSFFKHKIKLTHHFRRHARATARSRYCVRPAYCFPVHIDLAWCCSRDDLYVGHLCMAVCWQMSFCRRSEFLFMLPYVKLALFLPPESYPFLSFPSNIWLNCFFFVWCRGPKQPGSVEIIADEMYFLFFC